MLEAWSQTVATKPPLVAANDDDRLLQLSSDGNLHPAKTVPKAMDPDVDVGTAGSQLTLHDKGLNESYVLARTAVRVPVHLVGDIGSINEQPTVCFEIGNISTDVRDALVSVTRISACAEALIE